MIMCRDKGLARDGENRLVAHPDVQALQACGLQSRGKEKVHKPVELLGDGHRYLSKVTVLS